MDSASPAEARRPRRAYEYAGSVGGCEEAGGRKGKRKEDRSDAGVRTERISTKTDQADQTGQ